MAIFNSFLYVYQAGYLQLSSGELLESISSTQGLGSFTSSPRSRLAAQQDLVDVGGQWRKRHQVSEVPNLLRGFKAGTAWAPCLVKA
jgi:hypothetical protein